jgi:hypothetical protein
MLERDSPDEVWFSWRGVHRGSSASLALLFGGLAVCVGILVVSVVVELVRDLLAGDPTADLGFAALVIGAQILLAGLFVAVAFWIEGAGFSPRDYRFEVHQYGIHWSRGDHQLDLAWKEIAAIRLETDWSGLRPHVVFYVVEAQVQPWPPMRGVDVTPLWGIAGSRSDANDVIEALQHFGGMRLSPGHGGRLLLADVERLELPGLPTPLGELPRRPEKACRAVARWVWDNSELFAGRNRIR